MRRKDPETGKFISKEEAEKRGIKPVTFVESLEGWAKEQAKEQGISEDDVVKNLLSKEFMVVEFDESTGTANLKLYQDSKDTPVEKMDDEALYNLYKDLRENFAPVSAGIEYHKAFLCGSGFNVIVDDPSDKHKLAMKDEINLMSSKVYFDYYRKGLDRILWILSDDLLTFGAVASEILYEKAIDFEDFAEEQIGGGWNVRLVQEVKTNEWKSLKGIMRLKIIDKAKLRLTPHINSDSSELIYWGLDEKVNKESVSEEIAKAVGRKTSKIPDEEMGTKLLPWQVFWLSWNTRGTSLKGQSIIHPVLDFASMVRKILKAVGTGFEHWADRKYFFVCGSEKRPWNKQAIHNFIQYLGLMIKNKWTGMPVPQGFDVKEIGGTVFEGTNIINYLIGLICSGMNYPRDFLEYGRTRAGDKAWLAWQVKYGSNQRQLRRDVEHQLFQKHLWCKFGKTYKVAKQGVPEGERETADIYIPKIIWHAEGRWQQAEELKTLQGWLNVANPIGAEFKLAIEKRAAEILGFGEIEFPSFQDVRREMKQWHGAGMMPS